MYVCMYVCIYQYMYVLLIELYHCSLALLKKKLFMDGCIYRLYIYICHVRFLFQHNFGKVL